MVFSIVNNTDLFEPPLMMKFNDHIYIPDFATGLLTTMLPKILK